MSRLIETDQGLGRKLRTRDRQTKRDQDASPYSRSGLSVTAEGAITASGQMQSDDYDGTSVLDLGTSGWALAKRADGSSRLVLDGRDVTADLDAKDLVILGLIDELSTTQDALADAQAELATQQAALTAQAADLAAQQAALTDIVNHQVDAGSVGASQANYGVGTSSASYATATIAVPAGYTRAIVHATANASFWNGSVSAYCYVAASISGVSGGESATWMAAGFGVSSSASAIRAMSGLSGGTFDVAVRLRVGTAIGASISNACNIDVSVTFLR